MANETLRSAIHNRQSDRPEAQHHQSASEWKRNSTCQALNHQSSPAERTLPSIEGWTPPDVACVPTLPFNCKPGYPDLHADFVPGKASAARHHHVARQLGETRRLLRVFVQFESAKIAAPCRRPSFEHTGSLMPPSDREHRNFGPRVLRMIRKTRLLEQRTHDRTRSPESGNPADPISWQRGESILPGKKRRRGSSRSRTAWGSTLFGMIDLGSDDPMGSSTDGIVTFFIRSSAPRTACWTTVLARPFG